nr:PREDICTED: heparan-sulfate 6-O-sulfotransferase 1-like [Pelecanus crispus]
MDSCRLIVGCATPSEGVVGTQLYGDFGMAWGAVRWHAGIAASGPSEEAEIQSLIPVVVLPHQPNAMKVHSGPCLLPEMDVLVKVLLLGKTKMVGNEKEKHGSNVAQTTLCEILKFYYITLLRDPVSRYLSEWRHVQRGATWKTSLHMCDGRTPTPEELPSCYEGTDWSGCTLQEFMDCPYNLANNRQVRMLADLSLVGCYNMSFIPENKRAQILLESAKKNLKDMAFFGLTEFQRKTQYLFERTFNLKFIRPFMQYNSTRAGGVEVDNDTIRRIEELNDLDMQLYDYAKDLFQQRYQYKRQLERMEQRIKNREERLLHRSNEALPKEETEEQGRLPTEDYMSHIIEKW